MLEGKFKPLAGTIDLRSARQRNFMDLTLPRVRDEEITLAVDGQSAWPA